MKLRRKKEEAHDGDTRKGVGRLTAAIADRAQRVSHWWTPWSWADEGRLYYGDDGAWLYRLLPDHVLDAAQQGLPRLLESLHRDLGDRTVHLVLHSWSSTSTVPAGTPEALGDYLDAALRLPHPQTALFLGVKLAGGDAPTTDRLGLTDSLDRLLGETVPDLGVYTADRARVEAVLAPFGAELFRGAHADHLEHWYLLGASQDPVVTETETCLDFGGLSTLVAISIQNIDGKAHPASAPSAGPGSAVCLSVRGSLADGGLVETSIVCARRSSSLTGWQSALGDSLPNAEQQPLPLRQLPALSETLPCSTVRVNPLADTVPATHLHVAGFSEPTPVGDSHGLFLGVGGNDYASFSWWNPSQGRPDILGVLAHAGGGKTFLAEFLAEQALLCGYTVRFLSRDGEAGRPLVTSARMTGVVSPLPGLADPGHLPHNSGQESLVIAAAGAVPSIPVSRWRTMFSRATLTDATVTYAGHDVAEVADNPTMAAVIRKAGHDHGLARMLFGGRGQWPDGSLTLSIPHLLTSVAPQYRPAWTDLLAASALTAPSSRPLLVVIDDVPVGPATRAALARAEQASTPVAVVATSRAVDGPLLDCAHMRLAGHAGDDRSARSALTWLGQDPTFERVTELRHQAPALSDGEIVRAALFQVRDRRGRRGNLAVAPLREDSLGPFTRDQAFSYRDN